MKTLVPCLALASLLAACGPPVPSNTVGCWGEDCAVVVTSQYNPDFTGIGTLHTVKLTDGAAELTENIDATLDPSVLIKMPGREHAFVLNQYPGGTLRVYDPIEWRIVSEIPTGDATYPASASNPTDLYIVPASNKVYVTLRNNPARAALGVLDRGNPAAGVVKWIALPVDPADPDGSPEASNLYVCNQKLYVSLESYRYDFATGAVLLYQGMIAVVDLSTDAVIGMIPTTGKSPGWMAATGDDCEQVVVATKGQLRDPPDGSSGFERLDLKERRSLGLTVPDTLLEGRPFSVVRHKDLLFTVLYFDPQMGTDGKIQLGSARVVAYDAATLAKRGDVTDKAGQIAFTEVDREGRLFIGVGVFSGLVEPGKLPQGVYVGPADGSKLGPETRIRLGVPPGAGPDDQGQTPAAIAFFP
jgi:hypothetical protein